MTFTPECHLGSMARYFISRAACLYVSLWSVPSAAALEDKKNSPSEAEPPLERLVELNATELFGGEASFQGDRVTLRFPGSGSFARGFRAGGSGGGGFITALDDLKDPTIRENVAGGFNAAFSFAGIEGGQALSKFELAGDFTISFRMRVPQVSSASSMILRMHQEDAKSYLQTSFFREVSVLEGGKSRKKEAADAAFSGTPAKWFVQKHAEPPGTPVEIVFKQRRLSVSLTVFPEPKKSEKKEIVSLDDLESPTSGKIALKFSKVSFGIADFVIEGKYSRPWVEEELGRLRKEKKLRLRTEDPQPSEKKESKLDVKGKRAPPNAKAEDDKKPRLKPREKRQPPDVARPDPEAEVDL